MSETTGTEASVQPVKIDIWSDIACPWCYIGKRKLEAGIQLYVESAVLRSAPARNGDAAHDAAATDGTTIAASVDTSAPDARPDVLPIEIEYHSFELSPDTPLDFDGSEADFLSVHKGIDAARAAGMLEQVTNVASSVGLHYDYEALQHTNTVKAHQLIHYAKAHGVQLEAKERLLKAYFEEGRHVGRVDDLADLAAEIGLDRADVLRSLESDEFLGDVRADQEQAVAYGIQGVPFFVFEGKYGVSGAQDATTFAQVLVQVAEERVQAAVSTVGAAQ